MNRRIQIAIGFAALAVAAVLGLYLLGVGSVPPNQGRKANEATYNGKSTGYWIRQLKSEDPIFREEAAYAIEIIGNWDEATTPALLETVTDENPDVLIAA